MSNAAKLAERYFPQGEEEETQRLRAEYLGVAGELATLVGSPGWKRLRERVQNLMFTMRVGAGKQEDMLLQVGRREGIEAFYSLMLSVENEVRNAS